MTDIQTRDSQLDAALTTMLDTAQQLGIECQVFFAAEIDNTKIASADLAALFSNVLGNAIAETAWVAENSKKLIRCKEFQDEKFLYITVKTNVLQDVDRTNNMRVAAEFDGDAFALKAIEDIIDKYAGSYMTDCKNNVFTMALILPIGA